MLTIRLAALLFLLNLPTYVYAEQQTLLGGNVSLSGYGGPSVIISDVNGSLVPIVGGIGAGVFDGHLIIGGGGYGMPNMMSLGIHSIAAGAGGTTISRELQLGFGFGGADIGWVFMPDELVHYCLHLLVGAGAAEVNYYPTEPGDTQSGSSPAMMDNLESNGFFVVQPSVVAELNVATFCRIEGGIAYRRVIGVMSKYFGDDDLSSLAVILTVKFGWFGSE